MPITIQSPNFPIGVPGPNEFTDELLNTSAIVIGSWVKITNNASGNAYISSDATNGVGQFTIAAPAGIYTVYTGPTNVGPWTATGNANYRVANTVPVFNVMDYGAQGNGVADDTAAIQAAFTAATGATCFIPDGFYNISSTLTLPALTTLTMARRATLKAVASIAGPVLDTPVSTLTNDVGIYGGVIDANHLAQNCLFVRYYQRFQIIGTLFRNGTQDDVVLGDPNSPGQSFAMHVSKCFWQRTGAAPSPGFSNLYIHNASDGYVTDCDMYGQEVGCLIANSDWKFVNVHVSEYGSGGVNVPLQCFRDEGGSEFVSCIPDTMIPKTHTGCSTTISSSTILDPNILAIHYGLPVSDSAGAIPANSYIGGVVPGVSFTLHNSVSGGANATATVTGTDTLTIGGVGFMCRVSRFRIIGGECILNNTNGVDNTCYGVTVDGQVTAGQISGLQVTGQNNTHRFAGAINGNLSGINWIGLQVNNVVSSQVPNNTTGLISASGFTLGTDLVTINSSGVGGAGLSDQAGLKVTAQSTASYFNTLEAIDAIVVSSSNDAGSGSDSMYGIRMQTQVTGTGSHTHVIGYKILSPINSGGATIADNFGGYIADQTKNYTPANGSGLHFEGPNRLSGLSFAATQSSSPDFRVYGQSNGLALEANSVIFTDPASPLAPSSNQAFKVKSSITASGGLAHGIVSAVTLGASADSDQLIALYVNPTFNTNAHANVKQIGLYINAGGITVASGGMSVTSGGIAVSGGGLSVTSGGVGVGVVPRNDAVLTVNATQSTSAGFGEQVIATGTVTATANNDAMRTMLLGGTVFATGTFTGLTTTGLLINGSGQTSTGTGTISVASGMAVSAPTIGAANWAIEITSGFLKFDDAASRLVPGVTSFSLRNNANSADNLIITDAGAATFRGGFAIDAAGHLISTSAGTPSTTNLGANVTSVTFTGNDVRGTIAVVMSGALAANTRVSTNTFATSYGATAPKVTLVNQTSGVGLTIVNFYVSATSTGVSFDLAADQALAAGTYTIDYIVIG